MPYLAQRRSTKDSDVVMKQVRKPVFIDNALHLGEIAMQGTTQAKVTINKRKTTTYAVASTHSYTIDEREDNIILTHTATPGHSSTSSIFYMGTDFQNNVALNNLKPKQRDAVKMFYGIDRDYAMHMEHIAEELNVTGERARQLVRQGEKALKGVKGIDKLMQYM